MHTLRDHLDRRFLALIAVAAILRLWGFGSLGLDHFDEGGYAMSARAVAEGAFGTERYPLQHFLSPPFQFGSAGLAMEVLGVHDRVLTGVSILFGIATVGLTYLFVAARFGAMAGVVSGTLLALSDFHVLYSRSGLTDIAFTFWFLAALVAFTESERRASWAWAVVAGLATGVAWNTKYHGWLAVVVAAGALVLGLLREREWTPFARSVARLALAAVIAAALYVPWALFVSDQPGGYARLVEEHSSYLRPMRAHRQSWTHLNTQLHLDGWFGRAAPGLAALFLLIATRAAGGVRRTRTVGAIAAAGLALGNTLFVGLAALVGVSRTALSRDPGARIALSFFACFCVLTPLYYPYPRLVLPWVLAASILAGLGVAHLLGRDRVDEDAALPVSLLRPLRVAGVVLLVVVTAVAIWRRPPWEAASTYRAKDGFRTAASELATHIPEGSSVVVWGEPGVVFYLRDAFDAVHHVDDVRRTDDHRVPGRPLYLVTSVYADRIGGGNGLTDWREAHPDVLVEVTAVPVRDVSDVRLLDDFGRGRARAFLDGTMNDYDLRLFRVDGPTSTP